jgi:hypothetical protein
VYAASETLQLSSTGKAPDDGLLHAGPTTVAGLDGPRYRLLMRFDLPALDAAEVEHAELVLRDLPCYLGDGPPVSAYPVLSDWSPETGWQTQPEIGEAIGTGSGGGCPAGLERLDVTGLVRDWSSGGLPDLGLELRGDEDAEAPQTYETPDGETSALDRRFDPEASAQLVITAPSPPAPGPAPEAPAPTGPEAARASLLLSGTLVDELGRPVAGGTVTVYLAVDAETTVDVPELTSTTTRVDGAFTLFLSTNNSAVAAAAEENDGWVNFDATAAWGDRLEAWSFSRRLEPVRTAFGDGGSRAWSEAGPILLRLDASSIPLEPEERPLGVGIGCFVKATRIAQADRYTVIGEAHVWRDQTMTWRYGKRADTDVGVGYSRDGVAWSVSGSVHVGSSQSAEIGDRISNLGDADGDFGRRYRTEFRYAKYRIRRTCPGGSGTYYRIKATRWNGGFDYYDDVKHLNGHCGDIYKANAIHFEPATGNGTFSRSSEDFVNYRAAVTVFGVSLSAQSGASKWVTQSWRFGRLFPRYYLCGDSEKPAYAARIFAGL